jgi:uncharacterized membrane protein (DUF373 family)
MPSFSMHLGLFTLSTHLTFPSRYNLIQTSHQPHTTVTLQTSVMLVLSLYHLIPVYHSHSVLSLYHVISAYHSYASDSGLPLNHSTYYLPQIIITSCMPHITVTLQTSAMLVLSLYHLISVYHSHSVLSLYYVISAYHSYASNSGLPLNHSTYSLPQIITTTCVLNKFPALPSVMLLSHTILPAFSPLPIFPSPLFCVKPIPCSLFCYATFSHNPSCLFFSNHISIPSLSPSLEHYHHPIIDG